MAFCAAGSPEDQARITRVLSRCGPKDFGIAWLEDLGLADAGPNAVLATDKSISTDTMTCKDERIKHGYQERTESQHTAASMA